jgi:hypothetical protein
MTSLTSRIGKAKLAGHFDPSRSSLDDQTDQTLVKKNMGREFANSVRPLAGAVRPSFLTFCFH